MRLYRGVLLRIWMAVGWDRVVVFFVGLGRLWRLWQLLFDYVFAYCGWLVDLYFVINGFNFICFVIKLK